MRPLSNGNLLQFGFDNTFPFSSSGSGSGGCARIGYDVLFNVVLSYISECVIINLYLFKGHDYMKRL